MGVRKGEGKEWKEGEDEGARGRGLCVCFYSHITK